jgi:aspartyl-tRNA(Asn)/glutamyl-tRNA(Gln) amidotransferase subunit B
MTHRTIIGLEVHVQLLTRTKLFCGCSTQFGLPPNSATCPVCTGMPGSLPVMNRRAFQLAVKAALALNCTIAPFTKWDRKNYFYPDLPKNYQISQYDLPFSRDGWLEIETAAGSKKINILRAHLEEDAGKMLHDEHGHGRDSLVDLNRTGTPLLEIVSQPEMETAEEAKAYLEEIRMLLRDLGVSDCEMQEGSLRCDANVNVHVPAADGVFLATPIVEIKNLNTFRGVERAIKYETDRQAKEIEDRLGNDWSPDEKVGKFRGYAVRGVLEQNKAGRLAPVSKATAGWNERLGRTEVQRRKEEASDYRYFPEPDLVPVIVTPETIDDVRRQIGESPTAQRTRLASQYGLSEHDVNVLTKQGRAFVTFFEEAARIGGDAKEASNWVTNDLLQTLNDRKLDIADSPISGAQLGELIAEVKATGMNKQRARQVFAAMLDGASAKEAIAKLGVTVVSDESALREIVQKAIAGNPKAVADYKKGKTKAADAIKGAVMRETKGAARMDEVQRILLEELEKT